MRTTLLPLRQRAAVGAAATLAVLALAGCGSDSSTSSADSTAATAPAATSGDTTAATAAPGSTGSESNTGAAVPAALQFTAPLVGGGEFDAATLAGTPTVFWFWAPT